MDRKELYSIVCSGLLSLAWHASLGAVEVYQWVDEHGVTHFSQWAPAEPVPGVSQRTLADEKPVVDPAEDRYAIEQTAAEMDALWEELEMKRQQRREQEADSRPVPQDVQTYQENTAYPYWPSAYPPRPDRPGWRPDRPDRPGRPGMPGNGPGRNPTPHVPPPVSVPYRRPGN